MRKRLVISGGLIAACLICCSLEKPVAPKWDTQLNIPLIDHTYTIAELIEGEKNFSSYPDGLVCYHYEQELAKTFVGDHLSLPDLSESFKLELDAFKIPDLPVQVDRYLFRQLSPEASAKHGTTDILAPFSFSNVPSEEHSTADLLYAILSSGRIRLRLYNGLPVPLQNILLTLQDPMTHLLILATPLISMIAPQDTIEVDVNAAGITFPPNARWLISGNSPGSGGQVIAIDQNSKVEVLAELREAVVNTIEARIPATEIEQLRLVALTGIGQNAVEEVAFSSGVISLTIDNQTPFTAQELSIVLPQLHRQGSSEPIQLTLALLPYQSTGFTIDLQGVTAKMTLPQPGQPQQLQIHFHGKTEDLGQQFVLLDARTFVKIDLEMHDMILDHFSGRLQQQTVRLDSTVQNIRLSQRFGNLTGVQLADAKLSVTLFNTIRLPLRFQGSLYGIHESGAMAAMVIDQAIAPGSAAGETRTLLPLLTPQNSDLLNVINIQPTKLATAGFIIVGDGLTYGRVGRDDYIRGQYSLDLPLHASWQQRTIISDTTLLFIEPEEKQDNSNSSDNDKTLPAKYTKYIQSAKLLIKAENTLPIGGQIRFYFAVDSDRLFSQPDVQLQPITIEAAPIDDNGRGTTKVVQLELEMSQKDLELFQNQENRRKTIYTTAEFTLNGTDGKYVKIYVSDFIRAQALLNLSVIVDDLNQ